jgi:hypothetical protein
VCLLGALLEIGTLGALLLSLTVGLFGFSESWAAPLVAPTVLIEGSGFLLLAGFGALQLRGYRQRPVGGRRWAG